LSRRSSSSCGGDESADAGRDDEGRAEEEEEEEEEEEGEGEVSGEAGAKKS